MNRPAQPDFAVLGGGLCGRLVAWRLAGQGHRVALYERGDALGSQAAAWVAAAMLAPLAEAASVELLITRLGASSLDAWPQVLAELPEPVFFQRNGTLVVWHHADRTEAPLFERRVRSNAPAELLDGGFVTLAGDQIGAAEPALAGRFKQGWLLPREGQLDNRQVLAALAAGLARRGVETHWNTPVDDHALPPARVTIDCRGLGAKPVLPTLRGIRGEVARVHAPGIKLTRPVRLLHPRYPLYIAPKRAVSAGLRAGAGMSVVRRLDVGQARVTKFSSSIEPYSNTMDIHINQKPLSLPEGATVADALAAYGARPPFAVALNGDFVARTQHAARALQPGDKLDVVQPVAGG